MNDSVHCLIAAHGFSLPVPACWDLVSMRGHPRSGGMVFLAENEPVMSLSWSRSNRQPDHRETLRRLDKRMLREHGATCDDEQAATNGHLRRWSTEAGDRLHALAWTPPDSSMTLILRQLRPGPADLLRELARSASFHPGGDTPVHWSFYGLVAALPPAWHLQGVAHYVGLARAVWIRQGHHGDGEAVLVLRRYACAERILDHSQGPGAWVASKLGPKQRLVACVDDADLQTGSVEVQVPADGWWRRLRGLTRRRRIDAWVDKDGRLVVQEWTGSGEPLPVQRQDKNLLARIA